MIPHHLKIFISSTFLDMHKERESLLKKVFVKLKKEAKQRGVEVTEIDLRWGITEEEADSGKTVKICLDNEVHYTLSVSEPNLYRVFGV